MSKNNRAVPSVRTSRLPAIIAISTILAISAATSACKPSTDRAASPSPRSSARILTNQVGYERERAEESRHPGPRRRRLRRLRRQELSRRRNRPLGNARPRRPCRRLERLGLLDGRLERRESRGHLRHRMRLARTLLLVLLTRPVHAAPPLPSPPRPEERAPPQHSLRRHLLLQGPALVRALGQGRPRHDLRGPARRRRRPRRLVRRLRRLRQAPLAPVLLELLQPPAGLAHRLGPVPGPERARGARRRRGGRARHQAVPQAPPRRGPLRRRLPRPAQGPERLVLHHRLGARPGEEARGPPHHAEGRAPHHPDPGDQGQVPRLRPGEDRRRRGLRGGLP